MHLGGQQFSTFLSTGNDDTAALTPVDWGQKNQMSISYKTPGGPVGCGKGGGKGPVSKGNQAKTKLCVLYQMHGTCRFGKRCTFSHNLAEAEIRPDLTTAAARTNNKAPLAQSPVLPTKGTLTKTKFCVYRAQGTCRFGKRCNFAHTVTEMQARPDLTKTRLCMEFKEGRCRSEDCPFAHGQAELRSTTDCFKKSLCAWYPKGKCRNGNNCRFAHGEYELMQDVPALPPGYPSPPPPPQQQQKQQEHQQQYLFYGSPNRDGDGGPLSASPFGRTPEVLSESEQLGLPEGAEDEEMMMMMQEENNNNTWGSLSRAWTRVPGPGKAVEGYGEEEVLVRMQEHDPLKQINMSNSFYQHPSSGGPAPPTMEQQHHTWMPNQLVCYIWNQTSQLPQTPKDQDERQSDEDAWPQPPNGSACLDLDGSSTTSSMHSSSRFDKTDYSTPAKTSNCPSVPYSMTPDCGFVEPTETNMTTTATNRNLSTGTGQGPLIQSVGGNPKVANTAEGWLSVTSPNHAASPVRIAAVVKNTFIDIREEPDPGGPDVLDTGRGRGERTPASRRSRSL